MTRRSTLIAVATLGIVAVPTAALAYDAPGYETTIADPTPAAGESITLTTEGVEEGEDYTLTVTSDPTSIPNDAIEIAGTAALAKTATGDTVTFTVTLSAPGTYTAAVTDATGALVGDEVLTVAGDPDAVGTDAGPALGATGFDGMGLAVGAGALVLAGAGAVFVARRRQIAQAGI